MLDVPALKAFTAKTIPTLEEVIVDYMRQVLDLHNGNVAAAARALDCHRTRIEKRLGLGAWAK